MTEFDALIRPDRYPLSSAYDPAWLLELDMGPHPLWLLEDLARDLDLKPGMRVLDLDHYLPYLAQFLRPGGRIGMATPGMTREIRELGAIPPHIKDVVGWEAIAWHTPEWWRFQWEITELVEVISARLQPDGWQDWLLWARAGAQRQPENRALYQPVIDMLVADAGEYLGFTLMTARKK
ncbi:hypothetical protein GCM10022226_12340 [Sphaerisporangium flaviroseum]|uniref:Methyltransferase n=1 Tax=Sphaerisporangium flaviroseum TaxID=509199 RepID=A0ABP7HQ65_9ACTN